MKLNCPFKTCYFITTSDQMSTDSKKLVIATDLFTS